MSQHLTVGHLLRELEGLDPSLPVRLAINPDFPFAHYAGTDVVVHDGKAFISDEGQEGYLSAGASNAFGWS